MISTVRSVLIPLDWNPLTAIGLTVVITMTWHTKYHTREDFLYWFLTEQEYIDAEFRVIIAYNFGVWVTDDEMHREPSVS